MREAFNIYGQSPLVAHFLRMRRLETEAGVNFRVQRTQMESLPPLDTPTYRELIRDSFKHVHEVEREYDRLVAKFIAVSTPFKIQKKLKCMLVCMCLCIETFVSVSSFAKKQKKQKAAFIKKLKEEQKEHKKREAALLNKPHEVKRLSDLLMLEMTVSYQFSHCLRNTAVS